MNHVDIPELFGTSIDFVADHRPGRQFAEVLAHEGFRVVLS